MYNGHQLIYLLWSKDTGTVLLGGVCTIVHWSRCHVVNCLDPKTLEQNTEVNCLSVCGCIIPRSFSSSHHILYIHSQYNEVCAENFVQKCKGNKRLARSSYTSRRKRLFAEMREQMAKTMKAMNDMAMEPFAMLGKGSLPQLSTRSPTRAVADDDDDIKRYANTWNNKSQHWSLLADIEQLKCRACSLKTSSYLGLYYHIVNKRKENRNNSRAQLRLRYNWWVACLNLVPEHSQKSIHVLRGRWHKRHHLKFRWRGGSLKNVLCSAV